MKQITKIGGNRATAVTIRRPRRKSRSANRINSMPEKIAAGLDEIRRAYPPAEAHRILESAFNMLADEGENRGGLLSTEDLLIFIQTARD